MVTDYETRAKRFIEQIFPEIEDFTDYEVVEQNVYSFNSKHNRHVIMDHGLTRIALITSDYVVKFDYDEYQVKRFGGCEEEIKFYELAERDGFEYLFAKITRFQYQGHYFYIMPRIEDIEKTDYDAWEYMNDEECDWCTDHGLFDLHCKNYGWRDGRVCIIDYGAHD